MHNWSELYVFNTKGKRFHWDNTDWFDLEVVQLDWLRFADWAYTDVFAVDVRFQINDQLYIPHQKTTYGILFDVFVKSQNGLIWRVIASCFF